MDKLLEIINHIRYNKDFDKIHELNTETDLRNDLSFDSLDLAELTVRIESEFGVDVFEEGIVSTVGDILNKLRE